MGWIGVDLDGTLAEYHGWGDGSIGKPVPVMVERVKTWLAEGRDVRIMTARISPLGRTPCKETPCDGQEHFGEDYRRTLCPIFCKDLNTQMPLILAWCMEHIGTALAITYAKDFNMEELWDDRCVTVEKNTGRAVRFAEGGWVEHLFPHGSSYLSK